MASFVSRAVEKMQSLLERGVEVVILRAESSSSLKILRRVRETWVFTPAKRNVFGIAGVSQGKSGVGVAWAVVDVAMMMILV